MQSQPITVTTPSKSAIISALRAFVAQRSGIDFADYGEREAFMGDYRRILKDGRDARQLLSAIEWRNSITAEHLIEATRAFYGRLQIVTQPDGSVAVTYCTGQYFPTEYRAAVCAVCAVALWGYFRADMPKPDGKKMAGVGTFQYQTESYSGLSAGEYIRKQARKEFGRGIASHWFN